ncbi:MAG: endonuclease [Gammaproteobacteria bacterium]
MSWVTKELNCGTRRECRRNSERFNRIEADLHNLFPARTDINDDRGSFPFGMVKGEARKYGSCDFEVDFKRRQAEPRPAARGDIARAMFYMADTYGFTIFRRQGKLLARWHREDPPSALERRRNDRIEQLQGTRNPFIDNPSGLYLSRTITCKT